MDSNDKNIKSVSKKDSNDYEMIIKGLADSVKVLNKVLNKVFASGTFASGTFGLCDTTDFKENNITDSKIDNVTDSDKIATCYSCCGCGSNKCNGCGGKGWVENSLYEVKLCPICQGKGVLEDSIATVFIPQYRSAPNTTGDVKYNEYYITC